MLKTIKNLLKGSFIKSVAVIIGGTAFAQIVTFLAMPLISRIYGPEAYGELGAFSAIANMMIPIAALTFPIAIVLPKTEDKAKKLAVISIYITLVISFFCFITVLFLSEAILTILNLEKMRDYLILIPIVILFSGLYQTIQQWYIRKKKFKKIANVTGIHSLLFNGSLISIGLLFPFAKTLITVETFKNGLKFILMIFPFKFSKQLFSKMRINSHEAFSIIKDYRDFPIYRAPEVFINSSAQGLPILILTSFFGPIVAGYYTLSRLALGAPSQLIGKAVGDVFYPTITEAFNNNQDISKTLKKATLYLTLIGLIPFSVIFLYAPQIFGNIFGGNWYEAGKFAKWISLWSFCLFINIPSVKALPVLSAQAFHLKFTILMLIVRIFSMLISYYMTKNAVIVVMAAALSSALLNVLLIFITIKISERKNFLRKI